ncbi:MAG: Lrp/AsnC family transcriptional regulator [Candidatus Eremiobacterota bacterium]
MNAEALMSALQEGLELVEEPFAELAGRLEVSHPEVLDGLAGLRERKLLRRLSPIFDTRMLGYDSSLVAFRIPEEKLSAAAAAVNTHPGVSHNYQRTHRYNLWFTLAVSPDSRLGLEETVACLARRAEAERLAVLRAVRTFKIGVRLDLDGSAPERSEPGVVQRPVVPLSGPEKRVVRVAQAELPTQPRPFLPAAQQLEMSEEALLSELRGLRERGVLRRVAAILHHRKAGFKANGMGVWEVPAERLEECGHTMASFSAVSHCYQRSTARDWPYNLFTMVHGRSREEVEETLHRIGQTCGLSDFGVLYSTTEFKKQRILYFTDLEREWEQDHPSEAGTRRRGQAPTRRALPEADVAYLTTP